MLGLIPLLAIAVLALIFGGFYYWARRQGLLSTEPTAGQHPEGKRRISLLTEAVAYVGAILLLAGAAAAIGQRWDQIGGWGHVGAFAAAAAFFLIVGIVVRRIQEPAVQRLTSVAWFLSVAGVAGAAGLYMSDIYGHGHALTLTVGVVVTVYSAGLWLVRRHALQNVALFAGLVVTVCGVIVAIADPAPSLAFALALWACGVAWAWFGWRAYVQPMWVTVPAGVVLALIAPSFTVGEHGWMFAIAIASATVVMAVSVPLRNTPLLAAGTLAMFGYVTAVVIRYFSDSLGVPAALAITGVLVIGLAVVSARLMRATHGPKRKPEPGQEGLAPGAHPPVPQEPGTVEPAHRDLPKAS